MGRTPAHPVMVNEQNDPPGPEALTKPNHRVRKEANIETKSNARMQAARCRARRSRVAAVVEVPG